MGKGGLFSMENSVDSLLCTQSYSDEEWGVESGLYSLLIPVVVLSSLGTSQRSISTSLPEPKCDEQRADSGKRIAGNVGFERS